MIHDPKRPLRLFHRYALGPVRCGQQAQLLHQGQSILDRPMFHDLALVKAQDIDDRKLDWPAGGGDTHKFALVSPMKGFMGHYLIPFSHLLLDRHV